MPNIFNVRFLIAALAAGVAVNAIATGKLDFGADKKFLGLVEDADGFGMDDIAKGAVIVLAGKLAANFLGSKIG